MKLRQIVCDKQTLTLKKENEIKMYGEEFIIEDEERAREILATKYKGKPVAEIVEETTEEEVKEEVEETTEEEVKPRGKKANKE